MKMTYDPTVGALTIRFLEERVECEVLRLNDQVAVDIGPGERIVAKEILRLRAQAIIEWKNPDVKKAFDAGVKQAPAL